MEEDTFTVTVDPSFEHVSALMSIRDSCQLIRASASLIARPEIKPWLKEACKDEQLFDFFEQRRLVQMVEDKPGLLDHSIAHAAVVADIAMIGLMYECAKDRCIQLAGDSNEGNARLSKMPWAAFCRTVRNAMLHSRRVKLKSGEFPAWRGLAFTPEMNGAPLVRKGFFDSRAADLMAQDIIDSAAEHYFD